VALGAGGATLLEYQSSKLVPLRPASCAWSILGSLSAIDARPSGRFWPLAPALYALR
jgi:hypothetical protein